MTESEPSTDAAPGSVENPPDSGASAAAIDAIPPFADDFGHPPLGATPVRSRSRRLLADAFAIAASGLLHAVLVSLCLLVYITVIESNPGVGMRAGLGDVGQPLETEVLEGFGDDLLLDNALAVDADMNEAPEERPVAEPEVTLRSSEIRPDLLAAVKPANAAESLESLVARQWSKAALSSRSPGLRAALLRSEGGTAESERAVNRGLEWLAAHQRKDGSWGLSPASVCGRDECGHVSSESSETATALAVLPFLGAGHFPGEEGPYRETVEFALTWLASRVGRSGQVIPDDAPTHFHMYAHAIVTIALCEATALKPEGEWAGAAFRAAQYVVNAQNVRDGGWRYAPGDAGDTSVFGWQVMALRSARIAGMRVPKSTMTLCRRWLNNAQTSRDGSLYAYQPGRPASPVMTAEALLCRQLLGDGPRSRGLGRGITLVAGDIHRSVDSRNVYYWYYGTQLLHNAGGTTWNRWNETIRERLIEEQRVGGSAGHAAGSWQPREPQDDRWGRTGGPIMQTALSLLTLEVYYRYLPMYRTTTPDDPKSEAMASDTSRE